ncbi:uncharacterized protein (DUF58 family) [Diaminobutyricimonas aerilata]|uniref:Uncharacterized protein (DUF58 family) n=1 Tax=Diaminobutyricimonas aerilata TaxID=1162967 RepID=A0A2M9CH67_9MICO|nr:DUF58 domain-containing protein [Diaminobutyricimonas aerilata]PJJ71254.1 uncharacterized protein (DUF58 family) [Diaminobutyricimonas aerilata]
MAISGWFVALVAAGVVPTVLLDAPWFPAAWLGVLALLLAVDLAFAGSPRLLRFERELPSRMRLGETASSVLRVSNTGRRRVRGILRDAWTPSAGIGRSRMPLDLPPGERRALTTTLTPFRRGERRAAHVTVRSFGPLRLAARQATIAVPGAVRVLPPFASRRHLPSRLARLRELDGRTSVMIRGQGTEFDSLREYVRGDDVRSIDWRATARRADGVGTQKLMVRTWRPERDRRVVLVVDSGRTSAARIADEPRLDTAFEASLLLAALATRAGDRVDLVVYDRRVRGRVQGATGAELLSRMVDVMAPIEPELIEPDWAAVPTLVRGVTAHRSLVVLLTSIDAPGASRSLLAAVPQLTRTHQVVVASPTDPAVIDATNDRGDRHAVYRAAAAERALLDRERVAASLRRLGAEVVTGAPQDLPPALADRYLALKAAGRL